MSLQRRSSALLRQLWLRLGAAVIVPMCACLLPARLGIVVWERALLSAMTLSSLTLMWVLSWYRRTLETEDGAALQDAVAKNLHQPATLYPFIDPDICIGSLSCLSVCPEGDILGVVDGKAALINASACIGHGQCYLECPVDAIRLVMGTSQRGTDLPEVTEHFESARPGVFIIGELGGMGLIKNAMTQGIQLGKHLAQTLGKGGQREEATVDLAIVGAGPAGIAAALTCQANGLSHRVLDQDTLGGTVYSYPRQKLVMMEPVELPGYGRFGQRLVSKESLLEQFSKIVRSSRLRIEEKTQVTAIDGTDGAFTVRTSRGDVRARKVALAIGRRGTPRRLGVPGEELEKVTYRLIDPQQYDGARVLVVGGGDSALEAALQLVEQSDADVHLSYRNAELGKARDANKKKIRDHADSGRLTMLLPSVVQEIREDEVELLNGKERLTLPNDFVIVCAGGELPTEFLSAVGVTMRRHYGTGIGEETRSGFTSPGTKAGSVAARRGSAKQQAERANHRRFALALYTLGVLGVATLGVVGWDYYRLPREDRVQSGLHEMLRPSGPWGHGVGIVATFFMVSNFIYVVRKRWRRLKGAGHIRKWLTFHQFVGYMSTAMIGFHAAFQSNNLLATSTAAGVGVVMTTGLMGRYVFGIVTDRSARARELGDAMARWERYRERVDQLSTVIVGEVWAREAISRMCEPIASGSFTQALLALPIERIRAAQVLRKMEGFFGDPLTFEDFATAFGKLVDLRVQVGFHQSFKRFLRVWRLWHVGAAIFLVFLITAHIAVSLQLGFRWIF
jgi:dihydropyrimidine dehydrogenase (NAD+) subunit PreT